MLSDGQSPVTFQKETEVHYIVPNNIAVFS